MLKQAHLNHPLGQIIQTILAGIFTLVLSLLWLAPNTIQNQQPLEQEPLIFLNVPAKDNLTILKTDTLKITPQISPSKQATSYTIRDSLAPDGPVYNFEDISSTGTSLSLGDNEVSLALPLGFTFTFFSLPYTQVYASSNGFLSLPDGLSNGCCAGRSIPNPTTPNGLIAGWWNDLDPSGQPHFHYQTLGVAPNQRFIFQMSNVLHWDATAPITLQYKLFEESNVIEVHYATAESNNTNHTAGIEDDTGTSGTQYFFGTGTFTTPRAVRYTPVPDAPQLTLTKDGPSVVLIGQPITYTLTVSNQSLITATNLLITDALPVGATFVDANQGGIYTDPVISWTVDSLPGGASWQASFIVTASQTITNYRYGVQADGGLQVTGQPIVTTTVVITNPPPNLSISKSGPAIAIPNSLITYTLTVTNKGDVTATNVIITDTLPLQATFITATENGSYMNGIITWSVTTLAGGNSIQRNLVVSATQTISNYRYGVGADGGSTATGQSIITTIIQTQNQPPTVITATIAPTQPVAGQMLSIFYTYADPEGDAEGQTIIHWWRDDVHQPNFNNLTTIPAGVTQVGEIWQVIIYPHDGQVYGNPFSSPPVTIGASPPNSPPTVTNLQISPAPIAMDDDILGVTYTFVDSDGDQEGDTQWVWQRNGQTQPILNNRFTISPNVTYPGEEWCVQLIPHDGYTFGAVSRACIAIEYIPNHLPQVHDIHFIEPHPSPGEPLVVTYTYTDTDADLEQLAQTDIRWFRAGIYQSNLTGSSIGANITAPGETWCVSIRPHDGQTYGPESPRHCLIIGQATGNHPPHISHISLNPTNPTPGQPITLTYVFSDSNGDPEIETQIRWYRNGVHQPHLFNYLTLPIDVTEAGTVWSAEVRPFDGALYGLPQHSPVITLSTPSHNQPPRAAKVQIQPLYPTEADPLKLHYTFIDIEAGLEGGTEVRWYRNLVRQPAYDGLTIIPASETKAGEVWFARVLPRDNQYQTGDFVAAHSVLIRAAPKPTSGSAAKPIPTPNRPPTVENVYISPGQAESTANLYIQYAFTDFEHDLEGRTIYTWTRDGLIQPIYSDSSIIPAVVTTIGETWCVTIKPHDGYSYGAVVTAKNCVSIVATPQNTPPQIVSGSLYIEPIHPTQWQDLELHYTYLDVDGDPEGMHEIRWYRDGFLITTLNNQPYVPARLTGAGETWYAIIRPHDTWTYGETYGSPALTINQAPTITNLKIYPQQPTVDDRLGLGYTTYDANGDRVTPVIRWYRNKIPQPGYDDALQIPAHAPQFGETWQAEVTPFDGYEYGQVVTTPEVKISMGKPRQYYVPLFTTAICNPNHHRQYEQNDSLGQAQVCPPLAPGISLALAADDVEDYYHVTLTQTTGLVVRVSQYSPAGQLLLYYRDPDTQLVSEHALDRDWANLSQTIMTIPNERAPDKLHQLSPGQYFIRVHTAEKREVDKPWTYRLIWFTE